MLVDITWRCNEGCSHCMMDATSAGEDMSEETWKHTRQFIRTSGAHVVLLGGGEPTLHPKCLHWAKQLLSDGLVTLLISNGSFVEDSSLLQGVIDLQRKDNKFLVQLTCDPRYYPNAEQWLPRLQKLFPSCLETHIRVLIPVGRAREAHPESLDCTLSPKCSNLYLLARQLGDQGLKGIIRAMEQHQKLCEPLVAPDGRILAGEMRCCRSLGHVSDRNTNTVMTSLLLGRPCNACGLAKNLLPVHRAFLGMK